jgi:hypothetical protein
MTRLIRKAYDTMKKTRRALVAIAASALLLLAAGCAANDTDSGEPSMKVWGYVANPDNAQLELAENQPGVDKLKIDRVRVPEDAWIVVHADDDGKPGMRVGLLGVQKGESTDMEVELKDLTTPKVIVAIHADRGKSGEFDFDMMNKEMSPDRPFFVNEKELAKVATVREFGVKTAPGTAAIEVADQPGVAGTLNVDRALAPAGAWVVVHLDKDGAPGQRVGLAQIPKGENKDVEVKLDPLPLTDTLFVAIHADEGLPGSFEFDMMDKINSKDQPYFINGEEVATAVSVR